jgi:hypothetical protein
MTTTTTQLTDAVRIQMGLDDADEFAATMREVAKHGADWGVVRFTYYVDTSKFYDEHHGLIWDALADDCEERGFHSPLALLASLSGHENATSVNPDSSEVWDDHQFKNLLAWYALMVVARGFA